MKKILSLLTITIMSLTAFAQKTSRVAGTVVDGSQKTIESATIALIKAKDSSAVKFSVADKNGNFVFENLNV